MHQKERADMSCVLGLIGTRNSISPKIGSSNGNQHKPYSKLTSSNKDSKQLLCFLQGKLKKYMESTKKKSNKGLFCNALKTHLLMCAYWAGMVFFNNSFVESLCSFLSVPWQWCVCSSCQLADSCFIIPFQNVSPWTCRSSRASPLHLQLLSGSPRRLVHWSSKGMKMACCLHCCGVLLLMGVVKYLERHGWGAWKCSRGSCTNVSFSSLSVKRVCYAQSKRGLIICRAKQSCHDLWPWRNNKA